MKQIQKTFVMSAKRIFHILMHFTLIIQLSSCFLKQDRTTTVYGTITDQDGEPVDSILIVFAGVQGFKYDSLAGSYSNSKGKFETVLEIPKKYHTTNVVIPFGSSINPKFQKNFKDYRIYKNDNQTNNCCIATIGQKTKYDFQLIPK